MKKFNKLYFPILVCISFSFIYGTHLYRNHNHFYEIKHDEMVHQMLNDNNVKKINKIRAVRSLKYYNELYL